ncbi:D-alanyl-D-alanine carboxypeptidase family protein [Noviherbaspirillum pedocola]|uniref:serine-type D-Ala-D-Ala carboxypeptidase n=1 Tax=Noviherbaspirillum pedocola TaxID=2801341 RepID=A0A934SUR8_9BURK|nr:D-alanyl-D-alanine carboxypeptidase family protein [Noviherbaspirillum pedocola]MBK4735949.1 D-alanyl-D-alanine carboxypeptidase [Noviherbaspirillum pedocola]
MLTPRHITALALAATSAALYADAVCATPHGGKAAPDAAPASDAIAQSLPPPTLTAKTWVLYDPNTGRMLAGAGANERIIPASLTKVMTAYLICGALHDKRLAPEQMVNVSLNAYRVDKSSSKMFIDPKVPVSIMDLLYGLIIQSGNDAAVQLAEAMGGSEDTFAAMMNKKAAELGMKGSHFENASGLPGAQHYSTAEDLAVLAARSINDYPDEYKIYAIRDFTYNHIKQGNRNLLLYSDPTVDGMKTGHVSESGYNLIASAKRQGASGEYRLIAVVTGAPSTRARADDAEKLLSWGYANFEDVKLAAKGQVLATPIVWKGTQKAVKAGFAADRFETIAKGSSNKLKTDITLQDKLSAPLAAGTRIGTAKVSYDGKVVAEIPVVALENVPQAGFFARLWDSLRMRFG